MPDTLTTPTVRVLVALDVPAEQAADVFDLVDSVRARLTDEAGYLRDGSPVTPTEVVITTVADDTPLNVAALRGIYEVGVEGVDPCDHRLTSSASATGVALPTGTRRCIDCGTLVEGG